MKFAALTLLALSFTVSASFANPTIPLTQSPQQSPVNFSGLGGHLLELTAQENASVLRIAEGEEECGDSDGDGECDENGSKD
jgi:hypothetical protein